MRVMAKLGVLFYVSLTLLVVALISIVVLNVIPFRQLVDFLSVLYYYRTAQLIFALIAFSLVVINHIFWSSISGRQQKGKMIAFDNPSGRVTVSLSALEDLIRRVILRVPEVKEVRSSIMAGKKGLEVTARIVLNADVHIPEMTSSLQDTVKRKIQDTIGIEETVVVKINVAKIIPRAKSQRVKGMEKAEKAEKPAPTVPFQRYRG